MAKDKMKCPFSNKLCRNAACTGRHMNLCYVHDYRGYLGENKKPAVNRSFEIPKKYCGQTV